MPDFTATSTMTIINVLHYSSIGELLINVELVADSPTVSNIKIEKRIEMADRIVDYKLSKIIDIDNLHILRNAGNTPDVINQLSQYKSAELQLVTSYSNNTGDALEPADIKYWRTAFDTLLADILNGKTEILSDGESLLTSSNMTGVNRTTEPYFGTGEYGKFDEDYDGVGASGNRDIN